MADRTRSVRLRAIVGEYEAAMASAGLTTKAFEGTLKSLRTQMIAGDAGMKGLGKSMSSLRGSAAGPVAAAAAVATATGAVIAVTKKGIDAYIGLASEIRTYQRISGATAEESSLMVAALHAVGIESQSGATAVFRLSQNIDRNRDALRNAGVQIARDKNGNVDLTKTLLNLSDAYKGMDDPQKRNVLMMQALGRGAVSLAPLLAAGRDRIEEFWKAAERHNLVFDQEDLDNARAYKLTMHELHDAFKGLDVEIGRQAVPAVTQWTRGLERIISLGDRAANKVPGKKGGVGGLVQNVMASIPGPNLLTIPSLFGGDGGPSAVEKLAEAEKFATGQLKALSDVSGVAVPRLRALAETMGFDLATATEKEWRALSEAATKLNEAITPTERLAIVQGTLNDKYATGAEKIKAWQAAIDATLGSQLNVESASITLRQSIQTLADDFATGQKKGESYRTFQDRLSSEMIAVVRNIEAVGQAMIANGQLTAGSLQGFIATALRDVANQFPPLRGQVDLYLQKLNQIPASKNTKITADGTQAIAEIDRVGKRYKAWGATIATNPFGHDAEADASAAAGLFGGMRYPTQGEIDKAANEAVAGVIGAPAVGQASGAAAADPSNYLDALFRQRMEQIENRFKDGKASLDEYERSLDEQLAHEVPWTDAWVALQEKKADAVHYWTDKVGEYLHALQDHDREIQDNMFEADALGKDRYLEILKERLAGLEMYSDAWMEVWRKIQQVQDDINQTELEIIKAVEQQRQYDMAFYGAADQRALYGPLSPVSAGGSTTSITKSASYEFNAYGPDATSASATNLQKMRDLAATNGL